jgi:hypothetical protein
MKTTLESLVLAGATLALGTLVTPGPVSAVGPPAKHAPTVTVQNNRPVPVDVYVERGDLDMRVGTVNAEQEGVLPLPAWLENGESVRIVVHPKRGIDLESPDVRIPRTGTLPVLVPLNDTGYFPPPRDVIPTPGPDATTLTVENSRDEPVDVYVERGEFDTHLGTVEPVHFRTFDLPPSLAREEADVQVFVRPRSGFELSSPFFLLTPHAHLEVKVPRI